MDGSSMSNASSIQNSSLILTPHAGQISLAIVLSGVILLSIGGNVLVCVAVCTDRNLRRRSNSLYVSLAVADTLVSAVVMPFAVALELTLGRWLFGRFFCHVWQSMDVMCSTSSILHITVIAFDRYMHISDPFHYQDSMTCYVFVFLISGIWLFSGFISFIPIMMEVHEQSPSTDEAKRALVLTECIMELNPTYAVLSSCASFFLPSIFMVGLYVRLYLYAKRHITSIKISTPVMGKSLALINLNGGQVNDTNMETSNNIGGHANAFTSLRRRNADHKAAITVGVIMGTFLLCWVPFFTLNVIYSLCKSCIPDILIKLTTWLGYFNSCMNPLIYTLFNLEFRNAFRKILCKGITCFGVNESQSYYGKGTVSHHYLQNMNRDRGGIVRTNRNTTTEVMPKLSLGSSLPKDIENQIHSHTALHFNSSENIFNSCTNALLHNSQDLVIKNDSNIQPKKSTPQADLFHHFAASSSQQFSLPCPENDDDDDYDDYDDEAERNKEISVAKTLNYSRQTLLIVTATNGISLNSESETLL